MKRILSVVLCLTMLAFSIGCAAEAPKVELPKGAG